MLYENIVPSTPKLEELSMFLHYPILNINCIHKCSRGAQFLLSPCVDLEFLNIYSYLLLDTVLDLYSLGHLKRE